MKVIHLLGESIKRNGVLALYRGKKYTIIIQRMSQETQSFK